ncbi:hypothetical protein B4098_2849 [Heyndrickxia coagulans]|uniref:Uncharacterized protein n=1 Tax=Heyndrickxia coagulans TaxID=1398 RepID=A0A150K4K4_HEYCO|nr:hypothetical protein B4098_2849 [Heyndrickxia coagulans]KYC69782.1 hypothetical protein B4099_2949 [Heyndrickxia coagulans]
MPAKRDRQACLPHSSENFTYIGSRWEERFCLKKHTGNRT